MMPKNALLLHGTNGSPQSNWLPWLANSLRDQGFEVAAPQLPDASAPDVDAYWELLEKYPFDSQTIVVGHSSGAVMALKLLERITLTVDAVFAVAAFPYDAGFGCEALFKTPWNAKAIRSHSRITQLWSAPDDAYVTAEMSDELAELLSVERRTFPSGYGHFNTELSSRFNQFPELLEAILSSRASTID